MSLQWSKWNQAYRNARAVRSAERRFGICLLSLPVDRCAYRASARMRGVPMRGDFDCTDLQERLYLRSLEGAYIAIPGPVGLLP